MPTGRVDFFVGESRIGSVQLDSVGAASLSTPPLSAGRQRMTASYSGDLWYDPSSRTATHHVTPCGGKQAAPAAQGERPPPPVTIAAAGDLACGPPNLQFNNGLGTGSACRQVATSNLLTGRELDAFLPLGDLLSDGDSSLGAYLGVYAPTWGRWRGISHPAVGNHDYDQPGAEGYWDYWNGDGRRRGRAGRRGRGWYSYTLGSWRLVALNSNCRIVSCRGRSRQLRWLHRKLRRRERRCVLAYMHHPRFSSGIYDNRQRTGALWKALYRERVDVVLNAHDHIYERFAPQRPNGKRDRARGVSQFTVGTGGHSLFGIASPPVRHSRYASASFGVLLMRLFPRSYEWVFIDLAGRPLDHGSRRCRR